MDYELAEYMLGAIKHHADPRKVVAAAKAALVTVCPAAVDPPPSSLSAPGSAITRTWTEHVAAWRAA